MVRLLTATTLAALLSISAVSIASAAPSAQVVTGSHVAAPALLQDVHWERRGHHRVWVPDHRRAYGRHGN